MEVRFVVSHAHDHQKKICRDTGPRYAESLGLAWVDITSVDPAGCDALIIDNDLSDAEVGLARRLIDRESVPVLLKMVDPYWGRENRAPTQRPYIRLVEEACSRANVGILSVYEPREWLADLVSRQRPRCVVLPYPYLVDQELPLDAENFSARRDRAILTGRISRRRYPLRAQLALRRMFSWRYRKNIEVLRHPGYPDIGHTLQHSILFDNFVRFLAGYRYCYLCPSRADLEFLKYTECAYAGCVPVGVAASSIAREAHECFLDETSFLESLRREPASTRHREHFERAQLYRQIMRASRQPENLRERLIEFVHAHF